MAIFFVQNTSDLFLLTYINGRAILLSKKRTDVLICGRVGIERGSRWMLWLSRKDIEHISRRLLRDYLKKVPQKIDHIDPADFAEKMCGLQFTFADISEAHDAIALRQLRG